MSRVLVVEDDESMRGLIRDRLGPFYDVTDTGDATEALGLALAFVHAQDRRKGELAVRRIFADSFAHGVRVAAAPAAGVRATSRIDEG